MTPLKRSILPPLLAGWRRAVIFSARRMPLDSPGTCAALSVLSFLAAWCLLPNLTRYAGESPLVSDALSGSPFGWLGLWAVQRAMQLGACVGVWLFQARCLQLCYPRYYDPYAAAGPAPVGGGPARRHARESERSGFVIGGMPVNGDDLRTSVLVTGVTGSSKTAGVLMPALAQLFETYNRESADGRSPDEFQKIGAFIPEVKGDLVDGCIYLAHQAGRCVSRDVMIIAPSCRIPVVRYRDERGRFWFLSARGGAGGSDAGELLPRLRFPEGHPCAGSVVSPSVFENPADTEAIMGALAAIPHQVDDSRFRFIGWRWEGASLTRVSHTVTRERTEPLVGPDGGAQRADPPRSLTVDGVVYIDNGIHYNLVDPRLPAAEAAERLTRLAAMARGVSGKGENDYFYEQGRKVIAACIALHRAVEAAPCTAADIVRLATQDQRLASALAGLAVKLESLRKKTAGPGEAADELRRRELAPLEDLALFFREEWQKMVADGKTANIIKSTISGAFDVFLQDPNLAESFCRPSTFSFEDIAQSGKIVGLVPGDRYEQLGRLLGTACKLDFQSTMLARNGRPDLNATRLVLYFADECHKYVISGSATAGDPYFMNLSRSNNVVNICATQSYAWIVEVIGREAANVYISAFGVQFWLQQTDPETCRRAAEVCGTVMREQVTAEHDFDLSGLRTALGGGQGLVLRRRVREEERARFRPEDFAHLDVGEMIAYNKGRRGKHAKVVKGSALYHFCTEKPDGLAAVRDRVREYYRELLENLTHDRGESQRWDCGPGASEVASDPACAESAGEYGVALTAAQIERERAEFKAHLGGLDAAIEDLGGAEPLSLAIGIEEARRRATQAERPAESFGLALSLGSGGLSSEVPRLAAPAAVSPDTAGLPYDGNLAVLVGAQDRSRRARFPKERLCA